jgi:hypothetical protein
MRAVAILLTPLLGLGLASQRLSAEEQFLRFQQRHSKVYTSAAEERLRFGVFQDNLAAVEAHNAAGGSTYTRGVNQWSDLTQAEWSAQHLGGLTRMGPSANVPAAAAAARAVDLPGSVDWREEGVVTAVKNQGQCGSCWAFGATEQIESYTAIASGSLVELSAQQVSCCRRPASRPGHLLRNEPPQLRRLRRVPGIHAAPCLHIRPALRSGAGPSLGLATPPPPHQLSEADNPYMSGTTTEDEDCAYDLASIQPVASITGYNNLPPNDQQAVMNHIANVRP